MVYTDPGPNGSASSSWARGNRHVATTRDLNSMSMAVSSNKASHVSRTMSHGYPISGSKGNTMQVQYCTDGMQVPLILSAGDGHPEELLYCPHCPYNTYRRTNLMNHSKTHTGEKPFACDHCSFRCSQKVNLQRHKLTHSGDKPFACPYCPHRGRQKIHIEKHVKVAHKDKIMG